jgi:DNA-binding beta-propeller fold protein YncE
MSSPQGIYIDQSNNIYVPDYDNACVYKFTSPGAPATPSVAVGDEGNPGSALNQLDGPMVIVFDSTETYMFVADSSNDRIIRFSTNAAGNSDGVVVAVSNETCRKQQSPL